MKPILVPLKVLGDERGAVLHMLRADAPHFHTFGEVYFSEVLPGIVKGWKWHDRVTQHFCVPHGYAEFIVADSFGQAVSYKLGRPDNYQLLIVPPRTWYAFRSLSESPTLIANCTDIPHDPSEAQTRTLDDPPVVWDWS